MSNLRIALVCVLPILAGCGQWNVDSDVGGKEVRGIAEEMRQARLSHARLLQQQRQYREAIVEYKKALEFSTSPAERQQARLGVARCLVHLEDHTAALVTLKPLPLGRGSDMDRQVLAVAGEAMLHLGQYEDAETILELALDDMTNESRALASWRAPCCGNLGYAYMKNTKLDKAVSLYCLAARLYVQQGNAAAARRASRLAEDLQSLIQRHTRHRPLEPSP
jgi:tetratricopeptide (TPR) repeat protein